MQETYGFFLCASFLNKKQITFKEWDVLYPVLLPSTCY